MGGDAAQGRRRFDHESAAHREEEIAITGDLNGTLEGLRAEILAEHDGGRLEDPAASSARRVLLACLDPRQRGRHGRPVPAAHAHGPEHVAMQFEQVVRRRTALRMQPVDVLADHPGVDPRPGKLGKRMMCRVRLGAPGWVGPPELPGLPPNVGVADIFTKAGCREAGVLRRLPAAEVGNARVGGDACAGERGDDTHALGPVRHLRGVCPVIRGHGTILTPRPAGRNAQPS